MKAIVAICAFICLAIISGQAAAQLYGTKVKSGDPDVGLPLSNFAPIPAPTPAPMAQEDYWISYWDLNANGIYDDQDVPYLQFGTANVPPAQRIVRANSIRLTGWGVCPAGSYVKASDPDIGQQLNTFPQIPSHALPATAFVGFYYLDVAGSAGYDLDDPVYVKTQLPITATLGTNDIRITGFAGFPAGSRVSLADPDAGQTLTPFKVDIPNIPPPPPSPRQTGGPGPAGANTQIGSLMFYNANGNIIATVANPANPIFDDGDMVYFHVGAGGPGAAVGPNDIRLF
jgi:hypothetical protein